MTRVNGCATRLANDNYLACPLMPRRICHATRLYVQLTLGAALKCIWGSRSFARRRDDALETKTQAAGGNGSLAHPWNSLQAMFSTETGYAYPLLTTTPYRQVR